MHIPTNLKHKPVIVSEEYDKVDGRYANKSDIVALSLGLAQMNDRSGLENSAKIWRHTGNKWSSLSEELPFHRVLDLAILVCRSKIFFRRQYLDEEQGYLSNPRIDRIGVQGGAINVSACTDNEHIKEDMKQFDEYLRKDDEMISERLNVLGGLIKELQEL